MRIASATVLLVGLAASAAEPAETYPQRDGKETVAQYAKRAGLEPAKTPDLGNGVKLEMVLIPAGKFVMGTEEPEEPAMPPPVDEEGFRQKILTGQATLAVGGGALLVLLAVVAVRAIRKKGPPQFSLAYPFVMVLVAGISVFGGTRWWEAARLLAEARAEYQRAVAEAKAEYPRALARYKEADDNEKLAHEVTLTKAFYMGRFEVTQEQYQEVMGSNPSEYKGRDLPVERVSWDAAQAFCEKASEKTGVTVRLPTEAEWVSPRIIPSALRRNDLHVS